MAKHRVDIDEKALVAARNALDTGTLKGRQHRLTLRASWPDLRAVWLTQ